MNKSGIIILNKPQGLTTNHLIQRLKKKLNVKKIGHAGTLDPLATGVVICLINSGTKLSDYFLNENKAYEVTMKLFKSTDTYDSDGEIIEEQEHFEIKKQEIEEVVSKFNGLTYEQEPPMYSAIKVEGKKLYEYARENQIVKVKKRTIKINSLILDKYEEDEISLTVYCSKGTYIRSLIVDIAKELNTIAHVTRLNRIESGNFKIADSVSLEDCDESNLIEMFDAIKMANYEIIKLENILNIEHGKKIELETKNDIVFISNKADQVIACYEREKNNLFKCKRGGLNI
ncbi:tRNA pseudouridine synthase B [Mesoplasma entomophilum]|uniref:tRNA pseudouridine synthase B n=1 Tax=Mesoplasma entomophilum TaxID=2149 RepID=A0A3S5XZU6_9MOLU|nr:tRNA pseudouridine(55) synthase TruB [Mesoplasma entomophilum]ATQ35439.1 tRNA pseudouridine(55) synthase TruB [Mesoplasma entomophilum]ATZ19396.1 tRNA pseudouridine synthase B [Mesoplasma entomophilum]